MTLKTEKQAVVDNSMPYPEAPEVDHNDSHQEHYRGIRNPELIKKESRLPYRRPPYQPQDE